ncbi:MAG: hypothetical protein LBK01_08410 [Burkholderiaceae bacterium]|nr:hypothetical protein [Burkholderiaceae bacterium]
MVMRGAMRVNETSIILETASRVNVVDKVFFGVPGRDTPRAGCAARGSSVQCRL